MIHISTPKLTGTKRGFTLVETLIAVSLIAIAFSAFTDLLVKNIQAQRVTQRSFLAATLAQNALEMVRSKRDNHVICIELDPSCGLGGDWKTRLTGTFEPDPTRPGDFNNTGSMPNASVPPRNICVVENPAPERGSFSYCNTGPNTGPLLTGGFTRVVTLTTVNPYTIQASVTVTWENGANSLTLEKLFYQVR